MYRSVIFCLLISASIAGQAASGGSTKSDTQYSMAYNAPTAGGVDLLAQRQHQDFQNSSANIDTVSLQPWLQTGNWLFSLNVPWEHARGDYFVAAGQPSSRYICQASSTFLQKHPLLASYVASVCQPTTTATMLSNDVSGVGDISGFAHYGVPLDDRGIWLAALGLGYKADSGNVDDGLGTGTREVMFEGSIGASYHKLRAVGVAGYSWIVGGSASRDANDYCYASLDLGVVALRWLTVGATYDYQQAYVPGGDDVKSTTAYASFRPLQKLRLRVYARHYIEVAAYPDHEYGGYVSWSF